MEIKINMEHVETANDEVKATTYYGGYVTINGSKLLVSGTDRDDNLFDIVQAEIEKKYKVKLDGDEGAILFESLNMMENFTLKVERAAV